MFQQDSSETMSPDPRFYLVFSMIAKLHDTKTAQAGQIRIYTPLYHSRTDYIRMYIDIFIV